MKDKVLNTIKSIKFFNRWSLFYAVILLIAAIYNYVYNFQYYSFADVFINYQGGFVRRGLMGEMLYQLYGLGFDPLHTALLLCLVAYLTIVMFMVNGFKHRGYSLGLLCVSFLVGGVGIFGLSFFRRDFIELCILLIIVKSWTKMDFRLWLVLANALTVIAILLHEPYAFYGLPIVMLLTYLRTNKLSRSLLCWLPSFTAFLLCLKYSGNAEVYAAIMQSIKPYADYHNVIEFFTFDSLSVMRIHLHYNFFAVLNHLPTIIGSIGSILVTLYYGANATSQYTNTCVSPQERTNYFALLSFLMLCQIPMFTVLSIDYTRTCIYASISAYIVFFSLDAESCTKLLPRWYRNTSERVLTTMNRIVPPTRLKIFAIAFFIGTVQQTSQSTLGLFRDSEFGNTFMVLYKMVRLLISGC